MLSRTETRRIDGLLIRYASRRLPPERAKDAVQDTWTAFLTGRFEGRCRLETYLIAILRRRIADQHRDRMRWSAEPRETGRPSRLDEQLDARERLQRVAAELHHLPRRQREAIEAVALRPVERAELARDIGVSPENLRVLLHRGRVRLRAA